MENNLIKVQLSTGGNIYMDKVAWNNYKNAGVSRQDGYITHTIFFEAKESEINVEE